VCGWINRASPNTEFRDYTGDTDFRTKSAESQRYHSPSELPGKKCVTAGGHSGPPLRRILYIQSNPTSQATRCGVECGMGVPQGVPKEALRYKKTKRPPASARPWNIHPASAFKQHPSKELQNALSQANTAAHPYAEFVNITKTKAIQPAKQRDAGWNVEWACLKAYPRKHYDTRRQNVRRHRHDRGTSTPRAHSNSIHRKSFKMRYHRQTKRPSPTRSSSTRPKPKQPNQPSNASALT
jgi:hypothetical protein